MSNTTDHTTTISDNAELIADYQALAGTNTIPAITRLEDIPTVTRQDLDQLMDRKIDEYMRSRNDYIERSQIQSYELLLEEAYATGGRYHFACSKIKEMKKMLDVPEHIKSIYLDSIDYKNENCPICLDVLGDRTNTILSNCGHLFCKHCFNDLEKRHICKCPICNNPNMIIDKKEWYKLQDECIHEVRFGEPISEEELWNREYDEYGFLNDKYDDCGLPIDHTDTVSETITDLVTDHISST